MMISSKGITPPSAVMRLENSDIFHPAPLAFVTYAGLALLLAVYILVWSLAGMKHGIKLGIQKVRTIRSTRKKHLSEPKRAKIEADHLPENQSLKDERYENK